MYKNISMCVCVRACICSRTCKYISIRVYGFPPCPKPATSTDRAEETPRPILSRRSDFHSDIIAPLIPSSVRPCSRLVGAPTGAE